MAKMNGQTPEELAQNIVKEAVEDILVSISGVHGQKLDEILRYKFAKKIYSKGQLWFQNNVEQLRREVLESIIDSQYDQRKKQDEAAQKKEQMEYFQMLVSRGIDKAKALEMAGL